MRLALAVLALAACEPPLPPRPLPPLVEAPPPAQVTGGALWIVPGEDLIWEVEAGGMEIGRAEMIVRDDQIESHFATNQLASMFEAVNEDLTTPIHHGAPFLDPYTALAWLRAWSPRDARPAILDVVFDDHHYRVACQPPVPDELHDARVQRISCQVELKDPIAIELQRSDDGDRVPVRVVARAGTMRLAAELVSRTQRGSSATGVPQAHAGAR